MFDVRCWAKLASQSEQQTVMVRLLFVHRGFCRVEKAVVVGPMVVLGSPWRVDGVVQQTCFRFAGFVVTHTHTRIAADDQTRGSNAFCFDGCGALSPACNGLRRACVLTLWAKMVTDIKHYSRQVPLPQTGLL